jgi:hypothetical protein
VICDIIDIYINMTNTSIAAAATAPGSAKSQPAAATALQAASKQPAAAGTSQPTATTKPTVAAAAEIAKPQTATSAAATGPARSRPAAAAELYQGNIRQLRQYWQQQQQVEVLLRTQLQ